MRNIDPTPTLRRGTSELGSPPPAPPVIFANPAPTPVPPPWILEPFWNGDLDLDQELASRFPNMPLMSLFHARFVARNPYHALALLSTQDGAASVAVEAHAGAIQWTFTLGSMLAQRFQMRALSDLDREQWLDRTRLGEDRLGFLWSADRWNSDYVISAVHRYNTSLYAFSPYQSQAAARLTPDVTRKLLDWFEALWFAPAVETESVALRW